MFSYVRHLLHNLPLAWCQPSVTVGVVLCVLLTGTSLQANLLQVWEGERDGACPCV